MSQRCEKAVILARGLGTRMRKAAEASGLDDKQAAVADTGAKALIPIDRPFLDYVMHNLAEAGVKQVCLVIGPEHTAIREYYDGLETTRISVHYAIQEEPLGTADAVRPAEAFAAGDPFLVLNSDNYYPLAALKGLCELDTPGIAVFGREALVEQSNIPAERIKAFSIVGTDDDGFMTRIIEKPDEATLAAMGDAPVNMNCWRFGPSIFTGCRNIEKSPRGEFELPDAVQHVIDNKLEPIRVLAVNAPVLDMSYRDDIPAIVEKLAGSEVRL